MWLALGLHRRVLGVAGTAILTLDDDSIKTSWFVAFIPRCREDTMTTTNGKVDSALSDASRRSGNQTASNNASTTSGGAIGEFGDFSFRHGNAGTSTLFTSLVRSMNASGKTQIGTLHSDFQEFRKRHRIPEPSPHGSQRKPPMKELKPKGDSPSKEGRDADQEHALDKECMAFLEGLSHVDAKTMLKELFSIVERQTRLASRLARASQRASMRVASTPRGASQVSLPPPDETFANETKETLPSVVEKALTDGSVCSVPNRPFEHTSVLDSVQHDDEGLEQINQYVILDELGKGAQGTVFLAFDDTKQELRAIKEVKRRLPTSSEMQALQAEIDVMKKLRHKNIVALHEVIDDPQHKKLYLVMQYVEKGPLVKYTTKDRSQCEPIEPSLLVYFARQIAAGLAYIHKHGICHRDIKPENILRGGDDQVFLADFGVADVAVSSSQGSDFDELESEPGSLRDRSALDATHFSDPSTRTSSSDYATVKGTPAFFAPEVLSGTPECNLDLEAVDVWALGVTLFVLRTGSLPWKHQATSDSLLPDDSSQVDSPWGSQSATLAMLLPEGSPQLSVDGDGTFFSWSLYQSGVLSLPPEWPEEIDGEWKDLLSGMLCKDPQKRSSLSEVRSRIKDMTLSPTVSGEDPNSMGVSAKRSTRKSISLTSDKPMWTGVRRPSVAVSNRSAPIESFIETTASPSPRKGSAVDRLRSEVSSSRDSPHGDAQEASFLPANLVSEPHLHGGVLW